MAPGWSHECDTDRDPADLRANEPGDFCVDIGVGGNLTTDLAVRPAAPAGQEGAVLDLLFVERGNPGQGCTRMSDTRTSVKQ